MTALQVSPEEGPGWRISLRSGVRNMWVLILGFATLPPGCRSLRGQSPNPGWVACWVGPGVSPKAGDPVWEFRVQGSSFLDFRI